MSWKQYDIMHGERIAASICKNGGCKIYLEQMMLYNLYLEEDLGDDIDIRIQNQQAGLLCLSQKALCPWNSLKAMP